jgi:methyl coenzyme M reductase subunit C-like uncharacterized protein (methanogenesis marker protein 7)
MFANPTQQILALGRCRYPHRLEVRARPASKLHVCIHAAAARIGMKMKKGPLSEVKIRAVAVATCHVNQSCDGAKTFDQLRVRHPAAVDLKGLARGKGRSSARTAEGIKVVIERRHR